MPIILPVERQTTFGSSLFSLYKDVLTVGPVPDCLRACVCSRAPCVFVDYLLFIPFSFLPRRTVARSLPLLSLSFCSRYRKTYCACVPCLRACVMRAFVHALVLCLFRILRFATRSLPLLSPFRSVPASCRPLLPFFRAVGLLCPADAKGWKAEQVSSKTWVVRCISPPHVSLVLLRV